VSPTKLISGLYIECEIPSGTEGAFRSVELVQRGLYKNQEGIFQVQYIAQSKVYKVEPEKAMRNHPGTLVKVFVSSTAQLSLTAANYCKFGSYVTKAESI